MTPTPHTVLSRLRRSVWALPLAALAAMVVFGINEAGYDRSRAGLDSIAERSQASRQIERIWRLMLDAETGQRGYLLTERNAYLQPYQDAVAESHATALWLRRHYAGDREALPLVNEIAAQQAAKLSELTTTLQLHDRGGADNAWRDLVLTDIGREQMDALRSAASQLLELENRRVDAERSELASAVRLGRIGVDVMAALSLLGLFLFQRQTVSFERAQAKHAQALLAERRRLEEEVALRTADLTELARHLQIAREDEKGRLARELHDELGALMTAAKLDSARLKRMLGGISPEVEARLQHLNETINRSIELKRRIIEDLSPSSLRMVGLVGALEILCREFAARSDIAVHEDLTALELDDGAQITAFRMVQEALTNAAKYAAASAITVSLQPTRRAGRDGALVSVQDDGRGFDPAARRGSAHGLMGMRYRVEAAAGEMRLQSSPANGTRIEAWLPAPSAAQDDDPVPECEAAAVG
jgi:signal transduction histidine kinase